MSDNFADVQEWIKGMRSAIRSPGFQRSAGTFISVEPAFHERLLAWMKTREDFIGEDLCESEGPIVFNGIPVLKEAAPFWKNYAMEYRPPLKQEFFSEAAPDHVVQK